MENRAHALAAGLFILLLGAALVATVVWVRGEPIAQDNYVLYTRGTVSGLNVQAPVRYRGVEVGKVESIRFDPQDPRIILVNIAVRSGTPLTRGTYAELAAQGVTGLSFVQLSDEGATGELRDPSDAVQARIELRASFLERVSESGEQLVARIGAVAVKLEQWLDEDNRRKAMQTLAAFEAAAQRVGALADATQPGVKAVPELARQAGETMRRADAALADLRVLAASLNQRVDAIDKIAVTAERIGSSVQAAAAAGVSLSSTASRETIPRLNALLDEISRSTRSLERLLEDLSANPSSIVFGRTPLPPGPGEPGFVHGVPR
jgi:phospholipid/cholesterol/gamma-HCH transport system substrate-binding protein